jgi:hypothetical protein
MIAYRPMRLVPMTRERMGMRRRSVSRNARVAELVVRLAPLALTLRRMARNRPAMRPRLVAVAPASVLRREVRRAVEEMELERRQARRRMLRRSLALGAFAAAVAGGASRRRANA